MSIPTWEEAAESEFWEKLPQDLHEQAVKDYLGSNGDAIDGPVQTLIAALFHLSKLKVAVHKRFVAFTEGRHGVGPGPGSGGPGSGSGIGSGLGSGCPLGKLIQLLQSSALV